jgi:hypothetical protein
MIICMAMHERPPHDKSMTSNITSLVSVPHLCLSALAVMLEDLWGVALMAMGLGKWGPRPRPHSEGAHTHRHFEGADTHHHSEGVHTRLDCKWASQGMWPGQGTWVSQGMWASRGRQKESVQEGKNLHQMEEQAREIRGHLKQAQVELARLESDRVVVEVEDHQECLRTRCPNTLDQSHTLHHSIHRQNDYSRFGSICVRLHQ